MFKKSTITFLLLIMGSIAVAQDGPKLKWDEPDDIYWDNRFGVYGAEGDIYDIEYVNEDTVFVAGRFNSMNGFHTPGIAMWNGKGWEAIPKTNKAISTTFVTDIEYINGSLYFLSLGRFANFDNSLNKSLKSYNFIKKEFSTHTFSASFPNNDFPEITALSANESGILYALSVETEENSTSSDYTTRLFYLDNGDLSQTDIQFESEYYEPRIKSVNEGVVIYNALITSGNHPVLRENQALTYVEDKYGATISAFGVDSVFNYVNDFVDIGDGILVAGSSRDEACGECTIRKFDFSDNTWSDGYFFENSDLIVSRLAAVDENNYTYLASNPSEGIQYLGKIDDGVFIKGYSFGQRYGAPVHDINPFIQTGDTTLIAFIDSEILDDKTLNNFALFDTEIKRFNEKPTALGILGFVNDILEKDGKIYVGGRFNIAGNSISQHLAVFDGSSWNSIGDFQSDYNGRISSIYGFDKYIFVGGDFDRINSGKGTVYSKNIALYDTIEETWSSLDYEEGTYPSKIVGIEKVGNKLFVLDETVFDTKLLSYQNNRWSEEVYFGSNYYLSASRVSDMISHGNKLYLAGNIEITTYTGEIIYHDLVVIDPNGVFEIKMPDITDASNFWISNNYKFSLVDDSIIISERNQHSTTDSTNFYSRDLYRVIGDTVETFLPSPGRESVEIIGSNDRLFAYTASGSGASGFNGISSWNGEYWEILGSGISVSDNRFSPLINKAIITSNGELAIGGNFDFAGNKPSSAFTFWNGDTAPSSPITTTYNQRQIVEYSESLIFQWTDANFSNEFEFELSDTEDFSNLIVGITGIAETEVEVRTDYEPGVLYYWRVRAVNSNGASDWSDVGVFEMAAFVSNETEEGVAKFELLQNYPNPFNPSTNIQFSIPSSASVTLEVFDVTGRKVAAILDGEQLSAGKYLRNFNGSNLASGIYIYRISAGNNVEVRKMMLIK